MRSTPISEEHPELVEVYKAQGAMEANMVRGVLEANGIDSMEAGEAWGKVYGMSVGTMGSVPILVRQNDADRAKQLLADVASGEFQIEEDDDEPEGQ